MNNRNFLAAMMVLSLVGMSACSQPTPPADNTGSAPAASAAPVLAPEKVAVENATRTEQGVMFSVDPADVYACEGRDRTTSVIKWDVQRPEVKSIKVLISDNTNPQKKTLASMAPVGEAKTGAWVVAGLQIELVDGDSGKQLAMHSVRALPCD